MRSPSKIFFTSAPSDATTPAASCPMPMGGMRRPEEPSYPCTSLPQIPHAATRIRTSSGPGRGTGRSAISSERYLVSRRAFIVDLLCLCFYGVDDSASFVDGECLIGFYLCELFDLLRCRPFYFDEIDRLRFSQTEMQSQIALRHYALSAVDFVDMRLSSCHYANAHDVRCAVALGSDQFDLDPVLRVAAIIAQKGRQIVEIQNYGVDVAIVIEVSERSAATGEALGDAGPHLR